MLKNILKTNHDWTGLILRLTIGVVLWPHGAQKVLGLFGGHGFTGTMDFFTGKLQLPWIIALLVIVIEFLGSICMVLGVAVRIWAVAVIGLFIGIIFTVHIPNGFFMNWAGNQAGEGFEYHLLLIGIALAIIINGAGKFSIDELLTREKRPKYF
jgi:putative oxidoreductase